MCSPYVVPYERNPYVGSLEGSPAYVPLDEPSGASAADLGLGPGGSFRSGKPPAPSLEQGRRRMTDVSIAETIAYLMAKYGIT